MTYHIPDLALDGTVWGTSPLMRRNPHIEFFCCDPERPQTPSHVWWDGIAFAVDQGIWHGRPDMTFRSDSMRITFGALELQDAGEYTLEQLRDVERRAQIEAGRDKP